MRTTRPSAPSRCAAASSISTGSSGASRSSTASSPPRAATTASPSRSRRRGQACRARSSCRAATRARRMRRCRPSARELVVAGADFDECRPHAAQFAEERGYHFVPSFHADLVKGVATYALELFQAVPDLDAVYVPIGMGSGICGLITVRDLLGLKTDIIGVVADRAPAVALVLRAGAPRADQLGGHLRRRHGLPRSRCRADRHHLPWRGAHRARDARTRSPRPCAPTTRTRTTSPKAPAPRRSRP